MTDWRIKESISLYRKGQALASTREGGHITGDYDILEDGVAEDGIRTIKLKPRDKTEFEKQVRELSGLLAEKMGESKTGQFAKLLEDTLIDYREEDIERLLGRVSKGEKVSRAHCFRLYIGDGRKKNSEMVSLRD